MFDVFVYGTLKPGQVRWPLLKQYAPAYVARCEYPGYLYDCGAYPAAVFTPDATDTHIVGYSVTFLAHQQEEILATLDKVEGVSYGLFVQKEIDVSVYAYEIGPRLLSLSLQLCAVKDALFSWGKGKGKIHV